MNQAFSACPECDLLLNPAQSVIGDKLHCPRCGYLQQTLRLRSVEKTFSLSIAGFFLLFPANLLPMLSIKVLGNEHDGTLWTGVISLFNEDMQPVAILVFLSSIFFPALKIVLSLLISWHLYFSRFHRALPTLMRCLHHIEEWAMLEVYLLGIIVACVKLSSMADIKFGLGLYAFIALLIITALLSMYFDTRLFWQKIAYLKQREKA